MKMEELCKELCCHEDEIIESLEGDLGINKYTIKENTCIMFDVMLLVIENIEPGKYWQIKYENNEDSYFKN